MGYHRGMLTNRALALTGVALVVTGLAVAGCSTTGTSAAPRASSSAVPSGAASSSARDALLASTEALTTTSYHYHLTADSLAGQGAADPASRAATTSLTGTASGATTSIDMVTLGNDIWVRLNLGAQNQALGIASDRWLHIDASRLGDSAQLPVDPAGGAAAARGLLDGVVTVQTTDNKVFTGTLDLTKVTDTAAVTGDLLDRAGVKARALPFTATLDDQGRLSDLTVDLSSVSPSAALAVSFSEYGQPVTVDRPDAASVVEAPDSVYQLFGG